MAYSSCRQTGSLKTRTASYLLVLLFACSTPLSWAQSASQNPIELAGHIIVVNGNVVARGTNGDRPLSRREAIYVGDTIFTDVQASTQIRMVDNAIIALQESTEFAILAYQYEEDVANDESAVELIQGGFRTITGNIGQQNREAYEATISEFATIGIRGTDFEAVITPNGAFTGVYDGGIFVSNGVGGLALGIGANFDFAQIESPNSPPVGLLLQPAGLGNTPAPNPIDEEDSAGNEDSQETEEPNDGSDNDTDGNINDVDPIDTAAAGNDGGTGALQNLAGANISEPQSGQQENNSILSLQAPNSALAVVETETGAGAVILNRMQSDTIDALTLNPSEIRASGSVSCATNSSLCVQLVDGEVSGGDNSQVDNSDVDIAIPDVSGDESNDAPDENDSNGDEDSANDSDGNSGNNGNGNSGNNGNGNSSNNGNGNSGNNGNGNSGNNGNGNSGNNGNGNSGNNGNGNSGNNGNGNSGNNGNGNSGNNGNGNSGNNGNGDSGEETQGLSIPENVVDTQIINWGRWNNSIDDNFVIVSQIEDDLVRIATRDYLAQVNPTALAKLTGAHSYETTIASSFIGSGSAGDVSAVFAAMHVDFDTGNIDQGTLNVLVGEQAWFVEFDGSVHNGAVDLHGIQGQLLDSSGIVSHAIDATLGGAFTGDTGAAFVGGFDLIDELNTYNSVNGLFTIER